MMSHGGYQRLDQYDSGHAQPSRKAGALAYFDCPACRTEFRKKLRQLDEERHPDCEECAFGSHPSRRYVNSSSYDGSDGQMLENIGSGMSVIVMVVGTIIGGIPILIFYGIWKALEGCWWVLRRIGPPIYDFFHTVASFLSTSSLTIYVSTAKAAAFIATGAVSVVNALFWVLSGGVWNMGVSPVTPEVQQTQRLNRRLYNTNWLYDYDKLEPARKDVRVLALDPALTPVERLSCTMRLISLSDQSRDDYEAISYCWGDSTSKDTIWIDKHAYEFPASAVKALKHLRHTAATRVVWIDAVCVNQADSTERSHQVAIMGDVYRNCTNVLIWLGDGIRRAPFLIPVRSSLSQLSRQRRREIGRRRRMRDVMFSRTGNPIHSRTRPPKFSYTWPLRAFFDHPWFTRCWIIQEVTLAPRGVFCCSQRNIPMMTVFRAAAWLQYKLPIVTQGIANAAMIWRYADRRHGLYTPNLLKRSTPSYAGGRETARSFQLPPAADVVSSTNRAVPSQVPETGHPHNVNGDDSFKESAAVAYLHNRQFELTVLLRDFRNFKSKIARDKVYSILGLSRWADVEYDALQLLRPNYEKHENLSYDHGVENDHQYKKPLYAVFRDATHAAIQESKTLDILGIRSPSYQDSHSPTWVPQLAAVDDGNESRSLADFFDASGSCPYLPDPKQIENLDTLIARGRMCDKVSFVSDVVTAEQCSSHAAARTWLRYLVLPFFHRNGLDNIDLVTQAGPGRSQGASDEALGLTLVAGTTFNGYPADKQESHLRDWVGFSNLMHMLDKLNSSPRAQRSLTQKQSNSTKTCATRFLIAIGNACINRRLIITESGSMGIGPLAMQTNDVICILDGGKWPFVLRPDGAQYRFIGPAYVHGIMYGHEARDIKMRDLYEQIRIK